MIEIKNISKRYRKKVVINQLSAVIEDGSIVCIFGASGSGKSTLLNIIGLLDTRYSGELIIDGISLTDLSLRKREGFIRDNISYLFQNFALIDDQTVKQNLKLVCTDIHLMADALASVKIDASLLDAPIYTLSGGEQQRVALARCILKKGSILLADEPTGNLDDLNAEIVIAHLKDYAHKGNIVIIVTHNQAIKEIADQIIEL